MTPTLQDKQKVLTSKAYWLVGRLKVGDIVVIQEEKGSGYFIKRIAGMPGDEIEYSYAPLDWDIKKGKYRVPEGRVHVIGDNINGSDDSRKFGPFDLRRVLGKVLTW